MAELTTPTSSVSAGDGVSVSIASLGVFLPERSIEAAEAVRLGRYTEEQRREHEQIAVRVADDMPAPDMAIAAGKQAVERSGLDPARIGLLIHSSTFHQGPDGWLAPHYIQRFTIGRQIPAFEVRQGCNGMIAALDVAGAYLRSRPECEAVLLTAADNFSAPLVDRWRAHPGCVLGDGAAAAVVTRGPGVAAVLAVEHASVPELEEIRRSGVPLFPPGPTVGAMMDMVGPTRHYRENGGSFSDVGRISGVLAGLLERALAAAGIERGDITRVTHMNMAPSRTRDRLLAPLGIDPARATFDPGRRIGHLGASDQFIGLAELLATDQLAVGDHVLMVSVGPGVDLSCAILRITERYPNV